jgi:hypothetical protein
MYFAAAFTFTGLVTGRVQSADHMTTHLGCVVLGTCLCAVNIGLMKACNNDFGLERILWAFREADVRHLQHTAQTAAVRQKIKHVQLNPP